MNKVVVVTGGAQGIGKSIAKKFLQQGFAVVVADSDTEAGIEMISEYSELGKFHFVETDVSKEGSVKDLIDKTLSWYGRIDVLVNNAGIFEQKSLSQTSLDDWNRLISVNLTGAFLCAKHCAPSLKENRGCIINISSTRAVMSEPDTFAYSASKGGILSLTHSLAVSMSPDVRVNCISPGWIEVSKWKKHSADKKAVLTEADHKQHPAGRVGRAEDVSSMAYYLASEETGFVTGANFTVDGGMTVKMIYV